MPTIQVKTESLGGFSEDSKTISKKVDSIESSLNSIIYSLDWDIKSASGIQSTASTISKNLGNVVQSASNLSTFFTQAQREYERLDNLDAPDSELDQVVSAVEAAKDTIESIGNAETTEDGTESSEVVYDSFLDWFEDYISTFDFGVDVVKILNAIKNILGGAAIFSIEFPSTNGVVFSVLAGTVGNLIEYYQSDGDMSVDRLVAEMALETSLAILVGCTGPLGAVALVGVSWISKYYTGKSAIELVSDTILDGAEVIGEYLGTKIGEGIYNTAVKIDETIDFVADKLEDTIDYVADKVEDVADYVVDKVEDTKDFVIDKLDDAKDWLGNVTTSLNPFAKWA